MVNGSRVLELMPSMTSAQNVVPLCGDLMVIIVTIGLGLLLLYSCRNFQPSFNRVRLRPNNGLLAVLQG